MPDKFRPSILQGDDGVAVGWFGVGLLERSVKRHLRDWSRLEA